ncbi:MAG: tetratricopeptide repeat protein [Armatimonadetes bacterium]|nr:tetratricopeptide repeat protein [Armatimonadota bacterium]
MLFSEFNQQFVRPDYLLDDLWASLDNHGTVHLQGPMHAGKSWTLRALHREARDRGCRVLSLSGREDAERWPLRLVEEALAEELSTECAWSMWQTMIHSDLASAIQVFLDQLMDENELSHLIVTVDDLEQEGDLWGEIEGCLVVTTGRSDSPRRTMSIDPRSAENRGVVRHFIQAVGAADDVADEVLERSGGLFGVARLYTACLDAGIVKKDGLPDRDRLFSVYLERLRDTTGAVFYKAHQRVLALLALARSPVSARALKDWGAALSEAPFCLFELRHVLRTYGDEPFYVIRYPELADVLPPREIHSAHRRMSSLVGADELGEAYIYALRFAPWHRRECGDPAADRDDLARRCWEAGNLAIDDDQLDLGVELLGLAVERTASETMEAAYYPYEFVSALINRGDLGRALRVARSDWRRVSADPKATPMMRGLSTLNLARTYHQLESHEEALEHYQNSLPDLGKAGLEQEQIGALRGKSWVEMYLGIPEFASTSRKAVGMCRELMQRSSPPEWMADEVLDQLASHGDLLAEAARDEKGSQARTLLQLEALHAYREAEELYRTLEVEDEEFVVEMRVARAEVLNDLHRFAEAEKQARSALELADESLDVDPELLTRLDHCLGLAFFAQHKVSQAEATFVRASQRAPETQPLPFATASYTAVEGTAFLISGRYEKARDQFLRLLQMVDEREELEPIRPGALYFLAEAEGNLGRLERALELYLEAEQDLRGQEHPGLGPEYSEVLMSIAWALAELGREEEALRYCREAHRALTDRPADPETEGDRAHILLVEGLALRGSGRAEEALVRYLDSIHRLELRRKLGFPQSHLPLLSSRMEKAELLRDLGRRQEALEDCAEAARLLEEMEGMGHEHLRWRRAQVEVLRGVLLVETGSVEAGRECLMTALDFLEEEIRSGKLHLLPSVLRAARHWIGSHSDQGWKTACASMEKRVSQYSELLAQERSDFLSREIQRFREWAEQLAARRRKVLEDQPVLSSLFKG